MATSVAPSKHNTLGPVPFRRRVRGLLSSIGPGVITGAADDDPSGIATYSLAGAQLGTSLLWTAFLTWPLMAVVQMMCARIGMVTGMGLSSALCKKFPRPLVSLIAAALFLANTLNIGADLAGMADAAELVSGMHSTFFVLVFALAISWATIRLRYAQIARVLKWLCLVLFAYVIAAIHLKPHWANVFHAAFIPSPPHTRAAWQMLVAILGTTISPYLFFWQASEEVEDQKAAGRRTVTQRRGATQDELADRKFDVAIGAFFSNLVMFFIILTTAITLYTRGVNNPQTSREVAEALRPIAGDFAYWLYTLGVLGVGFLAVPTLTGSAAYAFAEVFRWRQGLDEKMRRAQAFYRVIILSTILAVVIDLAGLNPIRTLFWTAVVNGVLAPFLLVGILAVASDRKLMAHQPSSMLSRILVAIITAAMFFAAIAMFIL
jgi:NRAMP (natural resistance-associated macrophage protein)-like metal ion transporter